VGVRRRRAPTFKTAPNGNLFLVSLSNGAIYEISFVQKARLSPRPSIPL
jgi:hypothetical protein